MTGFNIAASALQRITYRLSLVMERRNTIPILSQAMMKWGGGYITIEATDLDNHISLTSEADTEGWGSCIVSPKHLGWLARAGGADAVVSVEIIEPEKSGGPPKMRLGVGDLSATMNLLYQVVDFPDFAVGNDMLPPLSFSQPDLHRLITMGRTAISTEETRYYLNGIFLHGIGGKARAVATDGHRMAVIDSESPWWVADTKSTWRDKMATTEEGAPEVFKDHGVIVPKKAVGILATLISPKGNEPVEISVSPNKLSAAGPGWALKSKMIDGSFPSYERVLPRGEITASMTLTLASIRRIAESPFSSERSRALKFDLPNGRAIMSSPDSEGSISAPITSKGDFEIGFNAAYVVGTARALGGVARFDMTRSGDPARVYGEDPNAMFVLMPMRV